MEKRFKELAASFVIVAAETEDKDNPNQHVTTAIVVITVAVIIAAQNTAHAITASTTEY